MRINKDFGPSVLKFFKNLFTKNILIKVLSLLFALLVWGYVMMSQNPVRTKTVENVTVNFDGESDLIARKLVVCGDREDVLKSITVKVDTELTRYADLDASDITASISLRGVSGPGIYKIPINAVTTEGNVISFSPGEVTIEVDNLVKKPVPVEISLTGELPAGYWSDEPEVSRSYIDIEGASRDISSITKAVCNIDLTDRTMTYNESTNVELQNSEGEAVEASLLGELPAVPVRITILRKAQLPLNVEAAITGLENLPVNYEYVGNGVSPSSTVTVIGEAAVIDGLTGIDIEPIDVSNQKDTVEAEVALLLPEGVISLSGDTVQVRVNIRQKLEKHTFPDISIDVRGLGKNLAATLDVIAVDVTLEGQISLISELSRKEVGVYADVTGLSAGTYEIELRLSLPSEAMLAEVSSVFSIETVKVTIRND